jgi:hypothetical protein
MSDVCRYRYLLAYIALVSTAVLILEVVRAWR